MATINTNPTPTPPPPDSLRVLGDATESRAAAHGEHITADPLPPITRVQAVSDKPFVCNICKRSYSRLDHLARHHRARKSNTCHWFGCCQVFVIDNY